MRFCELFAPYFAIFDHTNGVIPSSITILEREKTLDLKSYFFYYFYDYVPQHKAM